MLKAEMSEVLSFLEIAARRQTVNHFQKLENPTCSTNPDKRCSLRYCQSWSSCLLYGDFNNFPMPNNSLFSRHLMNPSLIINISLSLKGTPAVKDNSKLH